MHKVKRLEHDCAWIFASSESVDCGRGVGQEHERQEIRANVLCELCHMRGFRLGSREQPAVRLVGPPRNLEHNPRPAKAGSWTLWRIANSQRDARRCSWDAPPAHRRPARVFPESVRYTSRVDRRIEVQPEPAYHLLRHEPAFSSHTCSPSCDSPQPHSTKAVSAAFCNGRLIARLHSPRPLRDRPTQQSPRRLVSANVRWQQRRPVKASFPEGRPEARNACGRTRPRPPRPSSRALEDLRSLLTLRAMPVSAFFCAVVRVPGSRSCLQ